jgi:hypothetical protein
MLVNTVCGAKMPVLPGARAVRTGRDGICSSLSLDRGELVPSATSLRRSIPKSTTDKHGNLCKIEHFLFWGVPHYGQLLNCILESSLVIVRELAVDVWGVEQQIHAFFSSGLHRWEHR